MEILIVDDELRARDELRLMLGNLGMTGTIREASSVDEAMERLAEAHPDVIFLDIRMPGGDGFELLRRLGAKRPPVIFTTAYEQFAAKAFEEEAVDYLLKPFDEARLAGALSRIVPPGEPVPRLSAGDVVLLKIDGECILLPVEQIELIEATDRGNVVRWRGNSGCIRKTISRLEEQLDPKLFFRASRDCLINLRKIRSISLDDAGRIVALLPQNRTVRFSRRQGTLFQKTHSP